jgi:hypothetical protein
MSQHGGADSDARPNPTAIENPAAEAPDAGKAYDPTMTEADEANIPPDSAADPNASEEAG